MHEEFLKLNLIIIIFNLVCRSLSAQIVINEFMASNDYTIADNNGDFDDWLELANYSDDIINLYGWYLSDNESDPLKYQFSDSIYLYPDSLLLLWADNDEEQGVGHLNFKLSSVGEEILLTNPDQLLIDSIYFSQQQTDFSYGRYPNYNGIWGLMDNPTPGVFNLPHDSSEYSQEAFVSIESGVYEEDIVVEILSDTEDIDIYFSLDGSNLDINSMQYYEPITLSEPTVLRIMTIEPGLLPSRIQTFYYLINTNYNLPVMALVIDPDDFPIGLDEYNLHVTYFDQDGELGFSTDAGIERHGTNSTQNPYRIEFKAQYGQSYIEYPIFPNRTYNRYKRLILRNASNDRFPEYGNNNRAHLRDGVIQSVYSQLYPHGGYSSFQSVHVYINNSYWGIYHLRERQDRFYIEELFDYEDIDLLERAFGYPSNKNAIEGDWQAYDAFETFIESEDMSLSVNFEYLKENIYYEEFLDYWLLEIFVGNFDWLTNNMKLFRPSSGEDKWRWLLWDTDHGLGIEYTYSGINWGDVSTDYLNWSTGLEGPRIGAGSNNRVIRAILRNNQGKIDFINRFSDLLNTTFLNENLLGVLDSLVGIISPDIEYHTERWSGSIIDWDVGVNNVRNYFIERPNHVINHIKNKFELDTTYSVTIDVPDSYEGSVQISTITIDEFPWTGIYFSNTPVIITAVSEFDSQIFSWENLNSLSQTIFIDSLQSDTIFRLNPTILSRRSLMINEFLAKNDTCCIDNYGEVESFIEIFNGSDSIVSLNGMMLTTHLHDPSYTIIEDTTEIFLYPGELKLFWNDSDSLQGFNHIDLALDGNGGKIFLINKQDSLVLDSVIFDSQKVDISFGRYRDGADTWIELYPTPGRNNIGNFPVANLLRDSISFTNTYPYHPVITDFEIVNNGYSNLVISDIIIEDDMIHPNFGIPVVLTPGQFDTLSIIFNPSNTGNLSSDIILETNDPTQPYINIHVSGLSQLASYPIVYDITDTPDDEGFSLDLSFLPSKFDGVEPSDTINGYTIFRLNTDSAGFQWDSVTYLSANQQSNYHSQIPTICNFSSDSLCNSVFIISTILENGDTLVWSNTFEGFSIDNLSPGAPTELSAQRTNNRLIISWSSNQEQDIATYILDKSRDSSFTTDDYLSFFVNNTFFYDTTFQEGTTFYYRLSASDYSGNISSFSDTIIYPDPNLFIDENFSIPTQFSLLQNYPNPFNPSTRIVYGLPKTSHVELAIYDILGREVSVILNEVQEPGYKTITWYGTDYYGNYIGAGLYFYTIKAGHFTKTRKMVFLK